MKAITGQVFLACTNDLFSELFSESKCLHSNQNQTENIIVFHCCPFEILAASRHITNIKVSIKVRQRVTRRNELQLSCSGIKSLFI